MALERWPVEGIPTNASGWLCTTARRRAIDRLRRETNYRKKLETIARTREQPEDERLKLIFTCCHPSLSRETQIALTLPTVCGLTTAEIARAFLTQESTIAQCLVRARRKIAQAGIPYRVPKADELNERLNEVLAVIYLMFNEGYLTSAGDEPYRPDLVVEAEWLARIMTRLIPSEPEVIGLHALIQLHRARASARFDAWGMLVLLRDQDRSLWDRETITKAADQIVRASQMGRPGPYQVQAAIVACHTEAPSWDETDWLQIVLLYDAVIRMTGSAVARLNWAIALRYVKGPGAALHEVENLTQELSDYRLFHATRADMLRDLGRSEEAHSADEAALGLARNPAERSLLEQRLA